MESSVRSARNSSARTTRHTTGGHTDTPGRQENGAKGKPLAAEGVRARRARPLHPKAETTPTTNPSPSPEHAEFVDTVLERLRENSGAERVNRYFDEQAYITVTENTFDVAVPSSFHKDLFERVFGKQLRETVSELNSGGALSVTFRIDASKFEGQIDPDVPMASPTAPAKAKAKPSQSLARPRSAKKVFDERYDLSRYVVGEANEMAFDAACQLADLSGNAAFSRLFLHSECGLGKTHLLRGIARRVLAQNPMARVRYVPAEAFTNEYIASVQAGNIDSFRKRYRGLDLLCLDDIHFLSKKTATQVELLHTFDEIDLGGSRLVLASDGHPAQIESLSKALVNRFLSGLVVQIHEPDPALRLRLVSEIATRKGLRLEEHAARLLAEDPSRGSWSVRELEGALTRIAAAAGVITDRTPEGRIPAHIVDRALSHGQQSGGSPGMVRFDHVRDTICRVLEVEPKTLGESGRHKRVVMARALITLLCKRMTTLSYPEIARKMGKSNHSTVITAHQRIDKQMGDIVSLGLPVDGSTIEQLAESLERRIRQG